MTSFAVAIEPPPAARLACIALAAHLAAAASPWLARVPPLPAALLSAVALGALASTLAAVPGRHHRLEALELDDAGCRVRLRGNAGWTAAGLGPGSRAFAGLIVLKVETGGRPLTWLLGRADVPAAAFRRLKARVRLTC